MAYDNFYEVKVGGGLSGSTTGDKANWAPGTYPHYVRSIGVVLNVDPTGSAVVALDKEPTAGSATGRTQLEVINIASTHAQGNVVYIDGLNHKILPGERVVVKVTTAHSSLTNFDFVMRVEPSTDSPVNNSKMIKST